MVRLSAVAAGKWQELPLGLSPKSPETSFSGDLTLAAEAMNQRAASWRTRLERELAGLPDEFSDARKAVLRDLKD